MIIRRGRDATRSSELRSKTFTGTVWVDPVVTDSIQSLVINTVLFEPGARTYWHRHSIGQVLHVIAGKGWIANRSGLGGVILPGDVIHIPSGEDHWHGAAPDCFMAHCAISIGVTEWLEAVSERDYRQPEPQT